MRKRPWGLLRELSARPRSVLQRRNPGVPLAAVLGLALSVPAVKAEEGAPSRLKLSGTTRSEAAVRMGCVGLTKLRQYLYLSGTYALTPPETSRVRADVHVQLRGYYDAVHDLTHAYPERVRRDEQDEVALREAVVSLTTGPWGLQLGKQQTVWGEAIALSFADVINARDLREFILRDFADTRIPVWAVDARYHASRARVLELYWSPDVRFSRLPVRGSEFGFFREAPPPGVSVVRRPMRPDPSLGSSSLGLRYSQLWRGWDLAAFWYTADDDLPGVSKKAALVDGTPTVFVSLLHPRVQRYGATFSKPSGSSVWKGEIVFTTGRRVEARAVAPALERDDLTAMIGINHPVAGYNTDLQLFHTRTMGDTTLLRESGERTGVTFRIADDTSLGRLKPSLLLVWNVSPGDFWIRPRAQYRINDRTTLIAGFDWFGGGGSTLFGQFRDRSRFELLVSRRLF